MGGSVSGLASRVLTSSRVAVSIAESEKRPPRAYAAVFSVWPTWPALGTRERGGRAPWGGVAAALPALQPWLLPPLSARLLRWPQLPSELSALLLGSLQQSKPLPQSRPRRARTAARLLQPRCRRGPACGRESWAREEARGSGHAARGGAAAIPASWGDRCLSPSLRSCPMLRWIASTG